MRLNQLWQKLALGLITVAVAAIVVAYLLVNFAVDLRFQGYITDRERAFYRRMGQSLAQAYLDNGGWSESFSDSLPHFAMMSGVSIQVVDAGGRVIADTSDNQESGTMTEHMTKLLGEGGLVTELLRERVEIPIVAHGRLVGTVYVTPLIKSGQFSEDKKFRQSINSSLLFGGLLAALVALALSFLISTRLTRPLTEMTAAAKKMESGDLSRRIDVRSRDEIGQLGEAFNHMSMALQRQERLRKNLTADVAHELRTPLATIRGHIEAFQDGVIEPSQKNLASIHEEILRLGRLVDDLGKLAQAESGKLALNKRRTDLTSLTTKAALGLQPLFESRGVKLDIRTNGRIEGDYDEDKIKQVLVNLLVNAVKFTPAGGTVTIGVASDAEMAVISVSDTGIGIDSKSLPYVFERFYRVEKSRNRATGGSGIGLTIAKKLIELHGGQVDVTSKPKKGTTFTVKLPVKS